MSELHYITILPIPEGTELRRLYEEEEFSMLDLAKKYGTYPEKIRRNLIKENTKLRTRKDALSLAAKQGKLKYLWDKNTLSIKEEHEKLSPEKAYILGVLCGDASFNTSKYHFDIKLTIQKRDKEFYLFFKNCINKVYGIPPYEQIIPKQKIIIMGKKTNARSQITGSFTSKKMYLDLLRYLNPRNKTVPEQIKNNSTSIKKMFLRGMYDSEGSVHFSKKYTRSIGLFNTNYFLLKEIQSILENLGIKTKLKPYIEGKEKTCYAIIMHGLDNFICFKKLIGFTIKRKKTQLEKMIMSYRRFKKWKKENM